MKFKYITLLFIVAIFSIPELFAQTRLKVMAFNLHAGYDATTKQLGDFIKSQNPDIVLLQEVEYYTNRSKSNPGRPINNNIDMLTELAYFTGLQGAFFPAIEVYSGKYGNGILSKYPMTETRRIQFDEFIGTERRCMGIVKITLPDNSEVEIINTHLDMSNEENGMNQIKKLTTLPAGSNLSILGGDFNKRIGTDHINELTKKWILGVSNKFDHIAYYPETRWTIIEQKVFSEINLSDHSPIMVVLELEN